jgi:hypothetical protein
VKTLLAFVACSIATIAFADEPTKKTETSSRIDFDQILANDNVVRRRAAAEQDLPSDKWETLPKMGGLIPPVSSAKSLSPTTY